MRKAEELGCNSRHPPPQDCTTERPSTRCRRSTPIRRSTRCSCSTPVRRRSTSTPCCSPSTPTRTSTGCTPPTSGGWPSGIPGPVACTPAGIEALLAHYEVPVAGRDVSSSGGASPSVGRSASCCRRSGRRPTPRSPSCTPVSPTGPSTRRADILVAAAGVPGMIQPEHITPGGVVVGAGVRYEGRSSCRTSTRRARRSPAGSPPGRRRRADHDRPAVPQLRGGRRAPRRPP